MIDANKARSLEGMHKELVPDWEGLDFFPEMSPEALAYWRDYMIEKKNQGRNDGNR